MKKTNLKSNPKTKKYIRFFLSLGVFLVVLSSVLAVQMPTFAQVPTFSQNLTQINQYSKLPDFGTAGHSNASYEAGASNITSAILYAVDLAKYLLGTIAVLMIIISGIRLITSMKNVEEVATKQKENLKYAIIGLVIVIAADALVKTVFYGEYGEIFKSQTDAQSAAQAGTAQVKGIYTAIELIMATLAVLMIVIAGFMYITSAGKEEQMTKAKKQITWAVVGLIVTAMAEFVVKDIVFPVQGTQLPNIAIASMLIVSITNFVSGFVASIAIAMMMYGGYLYVIDMGKEEQAGKAKKVFTGAIIGLLLAMAAFGIVNTVIKLEPLADIPLTQQVQGNGNNPAPIVAPAGK